MGSNSNFGRTTISFDARVRSAYPINMKLFFIRLQLGCLCVLVVTGCNLQPTERPQVFFLILQRCLFTMLVLYHEKYIVYKYVIKLVN